jgi:tight adherence protein B
MTFLSCLLIFAAASVAVLAVASLVSTRWKGDSQRMLARVETEFTAKKEASVASSLFRSLDPKAFDTKPAEGRAFDGAAEPKQRRSLRNRLETLLEKSRLPYSFRQMTNASGLCGVVLGALASLALGFFAGLATGIVGLTLPWWWVYVHFRRRREKYLSQLPAAFDLMARVIRTGQSVPQALLAVADTIDPPIATEFAYCQRQQNLGLSPEVTYCQMADRVDILELQIFVMAMTIQRQCGGNLSDVLDRLAGLLRERQRLRSHVRTLTAEGRMQGLTLFCLPFVVFAAIMIVNRAYAMTLFDHVPLLIGTGVSMALGMFWIRRIIDIDY